MSHFGPASNAGFPQRLRREKQKAMLHPADHYERLSDEALGAAGRVPSLDERIRHLEKAYEYAKMASAERKRMNVYDMNSHRR